MIDGYLRERCFVAIICRKMNELGLKGLPSAKKVWPENKSAENAWRKIRNFVPPEKPRSLSLGEAMRFSALVGEPLHAILIEVEHAIKNGWDLAKDDPSPDCQDRIERKPRRQVTLSIKEDID